MKTLILCAALAMPAGSIAQTGQDSAPVRKVDPATTTAADLVPDSFRATPSRVDDMLMHALSLIGVKYRYGGSSLDKGFDCSGFVRHVFAESLALELPRSSREMSNLGNAVKPGELLPGDLLFYRTLKRRFSHVGIYLGDGRFVHAPSRGKRVEISDMSTAYWKKRFNGARRLID